MKSLNVSMDQAQKILKCSDFSTILLFKKNHFAFIDASKISDFYKNGYRPICGDYWLGMRMASSLNDLKLTDGDELVEIIRTENEGDL